VTTDSMAGHSLHFGDNALAQFLLGYGEVLP
jgi:hypothetical protein